MLAVRGEAGVGTAAHQPREWSAGRHAGDHSKRTISRLRTRPSQLARRNPASK